MKLICSLLSCSLTHIVVEMRVHRIHMLFRHLTGTRGWQMSRLPSAFDLHRRNQFLPVLRNMLYKGLRMRESMFLHPVNSCRCCLLNSETGDLVKAAIS